MGEVSTENGEKLKDMMRLVTEILPLLYGSRNDNGS